MSVLSKRLGGPPKARTCLFGRCIHCCALSFECRLWGILEVGPASEVAIVCWRCRLGVAFLGCGTVLRRSELMTARICVDTSVLGVLGVMATVGGGRVNGPMRCGLLCVVESDSGDIKVTYVTRDWWRYAELRGIAGKRRPGSAMWQAVAGGCPRLLSAVAAIWCVSWRGNQPSGLLTGEEPCRSMNG